jgi:hypothetical protein
MIVQSFLGGLPGDRITGYRNSTPLFVKLLGIGGSAKALVERFNEEHRDNILMSGPLNPMELRPLDEPVNGIKPNAVIVVYEKGEDVKFPFLTDRTASMLSFIVVEPNDSSVEGENNKKMRDLRAVADLYVTTSDREFVAELVNNLAS